MNGTSLTRSELRIGMRVKVIGVEDGNSYSVGKVGVVKAGPRNKRVSPYDCAVEFPRRHRNLWNAYGLCAEGRGFMFGAEKLARTPGRPRKATLGRPRKVS